MIEIVLLSAAVLLASLVTSAVLNKLFIRYGSKSAPGGSDRATCAQDLGRHIHTRPTGRQGGIAIFLTLALIIGGGYLAAWVLSHVPLFEKTEGMFGVANAMEGAGERIFEVVVLFLAAIGIFLIGVADDMKALGWKPKIGVQVGAAFALTLAGFRPSMFAFVPGLDYAVGVFWIVGVTNAFNFIDGMDGLCAGVAAIAAGILAFFMSAYDHALILLFLSALLGALLGFLRYNFYPAKIFLGDGGSTMVGFLLAAITLQASYTTISTRTILPFLMPIFVLAIPLYDITSVMLIRIWNRRSPFSPDLNHLHHRLKRTNMTDKQAVLFIYLMAFAVGINATLLTQVDTLGGIVVLVQMLSVMGLFVILERIIRREVAAHAYANGCSDRLLSVDATFAFLGPQAPPSPSFQPAVAREFTPDSCALLPQARLTGQQIIQLLDPNTLLKVLLRTGSDQETDPILSATCTATAVETDVDGRQVVRLRVKSLAAEERRKYEGLVGGTSRPQEPKKDDDDVAEGGVPVKVKPPEEVSSDSLQTPHDSDVT